MKWLDKTYILTAWMLFGFILLAFIVTTSFCPLNQDPSLILHYQDQPVGEYCPEAIYFNLHIFFLEYPATKLFWHSFWDFFLGRDLTVDLGILFYFLGQPLEGGNLIAPTTNGNNSKTINWITFRVIMLLNLRVSEARAFCWSHLWSHFMFTPFWRSWIIDC